MSRVPEDRTFQRPILGLFFRALGLDLSNLLASARSVQGSDATPCTLALHICWVRLDGRPSTIEPNVSDSCAQGPKVGNPTKTLVKLQVAIRFFAAVFAAVLPLSKEKGPFVLQRKHQVMHGELGLF